MKKSQKSVIRICKICKNPFSPDKYHSYQEVCSNPACQAQRQILNQRAWREKNRLYFRYKDRKTAWQKLRAAYLEKWRKDHKNYFKTYRLKKKDEKTKVS